MHRHSSDTPHADRGAEWPAGPAEDTSDSAEAPEGPSHHTSPEASDAQLSTSYPPRLPDLLTRHDRSGSDELTFQETESSKASSRIPAHSVLSKMLQESGRHDCSAEEDQVAAWSLPHEVHRQGMLDAAAPKHGIFLATLLEATVVCNSHKVGHERLVLQAKELLHLLMGKRPRGESLKSCLFVSIARQQ